MGTNSYFREVFRGRYSTRTAAVLVGVIGLTLVFGGLFTAHVATGPESGVQDRAVASIVSLLIVFTVHLVLAGIVLGGNVALQLEQLSEKTARIGAGEFDVDLTTKRADEVGRLYESVAEMRDSLDSTLDELEAERSKAREAQHAAELQNEQLLEEAERFSETMEACASGDLRQRLDPQSDIEALTAIAHSFNQMLDQLEDLVSQGQVVSHSVDEASTKLQASAEEISNANQEVSMGIQEISRGSNQQTEQLETAAQEVRELSATTEEVASTTSTIAEKSARVTDLATRGRTAATDAEDDIEAAVQRSESVVDTIGDLDEEAGRIEDVIETIDDIARQINMLALNAAIEASRSDGHQSEDDGDGFEAVADEVKELAEQTQEAIGEIGPVLQSIRQGAATSADEIAMMDERINDTAQTVSDLERVLETIARGVSVVDDGIAEIDQATADQAESAEELATIIEEVADVSVRTTNNTEQVAAAAEQTTTTAEMVSERAELLDKEAKQLAATLNIFTVDSTEPAETGELTFENAIWGEQR